MSEQPEQPRSRYELADALHTELFELEVAARGKHLLLDLDALEIRFGKLAEIAAELCERLTPDQVLPERPEAEPVSGVEQSNPATVETPKRKGRKQGNAAK